MAISIIGEFRVGEDLALALDVLEGQAQQAAAVTAAIKPALVDENRLALDDDAPSVTMAVAPQSDPAGGWTISLTAVQTAGLAPGLYGIDARIDVAGGVVLTQRTAFVSLTRAALA